MLIAYKYDDKRSIFDATATSARFSTSDCSLTQEWNLKKVANDFQVAIHANYSIKASLHICFQNFKYKTMFEGPRDKVNIKSHFGPKDF